MSIRLACPTCQTALTLPDTSAGKTRVCPKCNLLFRVPVPQAVSEKPVPEATLLEDSTPIPEPTDPRPAPRPIFKQTRDTPPPDELTRDNTERRSGERGRRRKRVRKKETSVSPGLFVAGGILACAILAGVGYGIVSLTGEPPGPKPLVPADDPPGPTNEGPSIPAGPTAVDLPKTWSINAPSLEFRAAWPVPAGKLGYTAVESLTVGYNGLKPISWSYTESSSRIIMTVSVADVTDGGPDAETTLDRTVDHMRRKVSVTPAVTPLTIGGLPGRQISYVVDGDRSIFRVTMKGTRLWTVSVVCPQHIPADDPRLVRFLNAFQPL